MLYDPYKFPMGNVIGLTDSLSEKADFSIIAEDFDSTATYAVGDYVIYNGLLYKCTNAHSGAWVAGDFTATLVSDEFGSGGGGSVDLSVIADEFSTSVSYAVGVYVTYNGKMYKCTTAHSGEWNASDFAETNVGDELEDCGGGEALIKGFKPKTWTGMGNWGGDNIWIDIDGKIYYSNGSNQFQLIVATSTWAQKTWQGVTNFSGSIVWNDGVHTYMSNGNTQYELDHDTDTWSTKTWTGLSQPSAYDIWTDGTDIYYDSGNNHYIYNRSDSSWSSNTWTGVTSFLGRNVWTDGTHIYLSNTSSQQLRLNVSTKTWSSRSWTCPSIANFYGQHVWTDGKDIFYSYTGTISYQWVLDKATYTWQERLWIGAPENKISAAKIWTDGNNYYLNNGTDYKFVLADMTVDEVVGQAYGVASLNGDSRIPINQTNYVNAGQKSGTSLGTSATAEGVNTTASGAYTHAGGSNTSATATGATAFGLGSIASHQYSFAEGSYTQTGAQNQHVSGKYNVGKSTTLFEVGNGTSTNARANAFEVEADGDVVAAGEITDGGNNVLSDKYDATSLVFVNERFTISASGWSSTQTSGYYTYTLSTGNTKYNTYSDVTMANVGVDDSTDATSAEKAAYALVNKFDMADGTGVDSFTLYAKTKPTTTFYIKLSGRYMAKNAASSTKALDIETGSDLHIGYGIYDSSYFRFDNATFNGSADRYLTFTEEDVTVPASGWSSVVDSNGYYTNTVSATLDFNSYMKADVSLTGAQRNTLPTAAQIAAYNLVDYIGATESYSCKSLIFYAKTKPTSDFYVHLSGKHISGLT